MHYILLLLTLITTTVQANDTLDTYITEGLKSNLALKQQDFELQQSLQALRESHGLFLPSISIEARYSRAGDGRTIDIPIGDLINPVHQTLNQLLGQSAFPGNLPNEQIPLLRKKEHDTKLRLVQPLFQPKIYHNHNISKARVNLQQAARDAFARKLIRDIKTAYYNHLKSVQLVALFNDTENLLNENLRVSQKLVNADKATAEVIYRAQAELAELQQQQASAQRDSVLSAAYFNFLLNRPQETSIQHINIPTTHITIPSLGDAQQSARSHRDEFQQLQNAIRASKHAIKLAQSNYFPTVNFVYDYGFEGESNKFNSNNDYWMASVLLSWNLFDGFQKRARTQQRKIAQQKLETQTDELTQQIDLQVRRAYHNLIVARQTIEATIKRAESARQSFHIIQRKYQEGLAPQIEYLDARNTCTRAEIQHLIATFDIHIHHANFEHAAARHPLKMANKH